MACEKEFYEWSLRSLSSSMFYNANRPKGAETAKPLDFNPWADGQDKIDARRAPRSDDVTWEQMGRLINSGEMQSKKRSDDGKKSG